jgi:hypothetical protein
MLMLAASLEDSPRASGAAVSVRVWTLDPAGSALRTAAMRAESPPVRPSESRSEAAPEGPFARSAADQTTAPEPDSISGGKFRSVSELHDLPWLAGDPAFDLRKLGVPEHSPGGAVDLELLIESDGKVHRCRVVASQGLPGVVGERLAAQFCTYQFNPARIGGYAVPSRVNVRVALSADAAQANIGGR